jgi:hypothetical protein
LNICKIILYPSTNNAEIERCSCVFLIALANNFAVDKLLIFGEDDFGGIVSHVMSSSNLEDAKLS